MPSHHEGTSPQPKQFTPLNSSNLEACHYDPATKSLTVKFKSGGTYIYSGVPAHHYNGLINAASAGRYLHSHIKGGFGFSKG